MAIAPAGYSRVHGSVFGAGLRTRDLGLERLKGDSELRRAQARHPQQDSCTHGFRVMGVGLRAIGSTRRRVVQDFASALAEEEDEVPCNEDYTKPYLLLHRDPKRV